MVFLAKFPGRCDDCREGITPGQEVEFKGDVGDRKLVHVVCDQVGDEPLTDLDRDAGREVCDDCFLLKPCICGVF